MSKYPIIEIKNITLDIALAQYLPEVSWRVRNVIRAPWFFFWNPAGTVRIIFNGETMEIGQEYAVLIPPFTRIAAYSDRPFPHLYAHFRAPEPFKCVHRRPSLLPSESVQTFFKEKRYQGPPWRSNICWQLLLWEYLMKLPPESYDETPENPLDERIVKAVQLCENQVANPPDNAELAQSVGMSINNFYRIFHREMGISPHRYREGLRLEFARKMLLESDAKITDIALQCGYADRYQFSKAFKKYFGLTPVMIRTFH